MKTLTRVLGLFFIVLFLYACNGVPESEYTELQHEYEELSIHNTYQEFIIDSLKAEIYYLKNGAPALLDKIKQFAEEELWDSVSELYLKLRRDFPGKSQVNQASPYFEKANEEIAWNRAENSGRIRIFESYLEEYPSGKYKVQAEGAIERIKREEFARELSEAKQKNTAFGWKRFIETYPNYERRKWVENRIIELEVDKIFADSRTGRLPSSTRLGGHKSGSSNVTIKNNTSYDLTIRYSGPSVKKVTIPPRGTGYVQISSGSYRVAASAGGLNYAGVESLYGDYTSTYYISRY